jgi:hypothetical protein
MERNRKENKRGLRMGSQKEFLEWLQKGIQEGNQRVEFRRISNGIWEEI